MESVKNWLSYIENIERSFIAVLGNKSDLKVSTEVLEVKTFCEEKNLLHFEVSAKEVKNIKKAFFSVLAELPYFNSETEKKETLIAELEKQNDNLMKEGFGSKENFFDNLNGFNLSTSGKERKKCCN